MITNIFAVDFNLSVDKDNVDINTPIQLTLKLNIDQPGQVAIKEIK
jgi:hypothetical protein